MQQIAPWSFNPVVAAAGPGRGGGLLRGQGPPPRPGAGGGGPPERGAGGGPGAARAPPEAARGGGREAGACSEDRACPSAQALAKASSLSAVRVATRWRPGRTRSRRGGTAAGRGRRRSAPPYAAPRVVSGHDVQLVPRQSGEPHQLVL